MIYTFIFGTPVDGSEKHIGKLTRVIVDNGIANQVTVDPGLLGIERVVPINALDEATADVIRLNATTDEWKAFAAYRMQQTLSRPTEGAPDLSALTTDQVVSGGVTDSSHTSGGSSGGHMSRTVGDTSIVLSSHTCVVFDDGSHNQQRLKGLVVDTGRPQQLLLDDGSTVPFEMISLLDENRIHVGGTPQAPALNADQEALSPALEQPLADRGVNDQVISRGE